MAEEQLVGVDIAMYNTMRFQKKCRSGELTDNDFKLSPVRPVRPLLNERERMMASCPGQIWYWYSGSDFTPIQNPVHMSTVAMTKRGAQFAVGAAAGTLLVNAIASQRARRQYWNPLYQGPATVSTHGVYVETAVEGQRVFPFENFESLECEAENCVTGFYNDGEVSAQLRIALDWAALAHVVWCLRCFPDHPNPYGWITQRWIDRFTAITGSNPLQELGQSGPLQITG